MTSLTSEQKRLLFDYCIGITTKEESARAQELIFSNEKAAELVEDIKASLAPLDILAEESCPQELEEITISRLKDIARSSQMKLQQLISDEQARQAASPRLFWRNFGRILSAAAVIVLVFGIYFSPLQYARNRANCQAQLFRIGQGITSYQNVHDGQMPVVASVDGAPWWKVGYKPQSPEFYSNTRHMWLLVKGGYVKNPADFVCPGKRGAKKVAIDSVKVGQYYDFPSREQVSYSFRVRCFKSQGPVNLSRKVLIADLNPLFEKLPQDFEQLALQMNNELAKRNSINHRRRGQTVLFCDGHVEFVKSRFIGEENDDIFTLQDTSFYSGCETPSCETDAFVAP